ncbi:hypothetical protein I6E36_09500 [Fusobacterium mortiferum]|uniref:hypothetical protein n=1 Tax=Fusobacterium mortiferum TaxID=850 RepID=UPI001F3A718A|nr:hypothetical protein [Fusobacterium mortiferum]MCF2628319.1 hypothetical protein [Fusobacterium mortiferum]
MEGGIFIKLKIISQEVDSKIIKDDIIDVDEIVDKYTYILGNFRIVGEKEKRFSKKNKDLETLAVWYINIFLNKYNRGKQPKRKFLKFEVENEKN